MDRQVSAGQSADLITMIWHKLSREPSLNVSVLPPRTFL